MKTRAWDGHQWRTDYVVMQNGEVWCTEEGLFYECLPLYKTDWELARFTGLCDIGNDEVYEHHILDDRDGRKYIVEWDQENCRFRLKEPLNRSFYYAFNDHIVAYMTVVGDIFTTPELLEVKA